LDHLYGSRMLSFINTPPYDSEIILSFRISPRESFPKNNATLLVSQNGYT
jgi:hypothetical protein